MLARLRVALNPIFFYFSFSITFLMLKILTTSSKELYLLLF